MEINNIIYAEVAVLAILVCIFFYFLGKRTGEAQAEDEKKQQEALKLWNDIVRKHLGG